MSVYPRPDIIPNLVEKREGASIYPTRGVTSDTVQPRRVHNPFLGTDIIPDAKERVEETAYKVILTDHKGFEETILESAETRKEAFRAYEAWFLEYSADPQPRAYPVDTWAECTRNGEFCWKTYPFIRPRSA